MNRHTQVTTPYLRHPTKDMVTWNIDFKQMGVGGDTSWGAYPHQPYLIPARKMEFSFRLCPAQEKGVKENQRYLEMK